MGNAIVLPEELDESLLNAGRELRSSPKFKFLPSERLPEGTIRLRAKISDSFNFVDHPQVELNPGGDAVIDFLCDCPSYKETRRFCVHCAALVSTQPALMKDAAFKGSIDKDVAGGLEFFADMGIPGIEDFSFGFCNSRQDLYPGVAAPEIPYARFVEVFGNNRRSRDFYKLINPWGGSCYGIAASSAMVNQQERGCRLSDFNKHAAYPCQLKLHNFSPELNMPLSQLIETAFILQLDDRVVSEYNKLSGLKGLRTLAARVEAFQKGEALPAIMNIYANEAGGGGHAVLPYYLEHTATDEDRLYIYDSNWPMELRFAYLEKDDTGEYINWRFPLSETKEYDSKKGGGISMNTYETYIEAWNNRGRSKTQDATINVLSLPSGEALFSMDNELLARCDENGSKSFRDDICKIILFRGGSDKRNMFYAPSEAYIFRLENPEQEKLEAGITGTDLSLNLSTAAREAELYVDEASELMLARIPAADCKYSLELSYNSKNALLLGNTSKDGLDLMYKNGLLYAEGITEESLLYIDSVQVPLREHIYRMHDDRELTEEEKKLIKNGRI